MRRHLAVLAAALVALGACGSSDRIGEVEQAIAAVLADRVALPDGSLVVTCPGDTDLDAGSRLECDVAVDGADGQPVALVVDDGGTVRLESAVIPTGAAEQYLSAELQGPAEAGVAVSCGEEPLLVHAVGSTFTCDAVRTTDSTSFEVTVEVTGSDGTVRYRVEQPTTTATSGPP